MRNPYLFAYGTLLTGTGDRRVDRLMKQTCRLIGDATLQAKLYDLGEYPGAVLSGNPNDLTKGRVYRLKQPRQTLRVLDAYEGIATDHDGEYLRKSVVVTLTSTGRRLQSWVYFYAGRVAGKRGIADGDYLSDRAGRG